MKVLYLVRSLTIPAGWERYAKGLIVALAGQGVEPIIVAVNPEPDPDFPFQPEPAALAWAEWGPRLAWTTPDNLLKIWALAHQVELIHALVEPLAPLAWLAGRILGRPYLVTAFGTYTVEPFALGRARRLAGWSLGGAAAVSCISAYTQKRLQALYSKARTVTVPCGFAPPQVSPASESMVNRPYILSVGPLKTRKGQHLLLEAFARLAPEFPQVDWVVAGFSYNQAYPGRFQDRVADLGLAGRVHLIGQIDEAALQRLYADCLFYALTPVNDQHHFEGFGLTYLEAGWYAKPSIGSKDCGAEESITDGVEGFLVGQDDSEGLVRALARLIAEPELRERMGQAARARAERMTWAATAQKTMTLYCQALGKNGQSPNMGPEG
ncbi:MAG: glycosyltransferase family 4 protein [Deltaproteobacteria bacterium]|nr:glycosyltransferase family 4 protein [Deltaproteobacteria bacterium]